MLKTPTPSFEYVLPVIRGIQSGREYYVSMCPVRLLPKLFPLDDQEMPPETRVGRSLNRQRLSEIREYILDNRNNYTFSAITASIDADIVFEPIDTDKEGRKIGRLRVPMDGRFIINDGKHRRAALELALKENPDLGYETIALILFLDIGLQRSQQMFADLNRYAVSPDPSLNILYDRRDEQANVVKAAIEQVAVFRTLTDLERSNLPARSNKLFTLNNIYNATLALLVNHRDRELAKQIQIAVDFWNVVSSYIPDWQRVLAKKVDPGQIRRDYVHCHAIVLSALGAIGATLLSDYPENWSEYLGGLQQINWARTNPDWVGRILSKSGFSQSRNSVSWMVFYLKKRLDLPLTSDEERL